MNNVGADLRLHFCGWLPVLKILELRRVSKVFTEIPVAKIFRIRLLRQIERICNVTTSDAKSLLAACSLRGGVISGSIILQVLMGQEWRSDLDIFVNVRPKMFCAKRFLVPVLELNPHIELAEHEEMYEHHDSDDEKNTPHTVYTKDCARPSRALRSNYTLLYNYNWQPINSCKFKNVQVIGMDCDLAFSPHRAATDHFDMSIVCNSFFKSTLEVWNLDALIARRVSVFNPMRSDRIEKYQARGFNVTSDHYALWEERNRVMQQICRVPVTRRENKNDWD